MPETQATPADPGTSWEPVQSAVTGADGRYALHLPSGTYRFGFADATGPSQTVFYDATDRTAPTIASS